MLTLRKTTNIVGESQIDGVTAERYTAVINSSNPSGMTMGHTLVNKTLAKDNRETCRADRAEFEDAAYALQDEMLAALAEESEATGDDTDADEAVIEG